MAQTPYAYFPGCTLHGTMLEYNASSRLVCQAVGVELRELKDWNCCGAWSAHTTDYMLGLSLPARNLQKAEAMQLPMVVPCAVGFSRMKLAMHEMENPVVLSAVNKAIDKPFRNSVVVEPLLKVLSDESLKLDVKKPLQGLKVACYYGCLLVRPQKILKFDDEDNPQTMDRLMSRLGAEPVDWDFKTECCGAGMSMPRPDVVNRLTSKILLAARNMGADCIAVACPMCHFNLDFHQREIEAERKEKLQMPALYFTQLMGLALGFSARDLMLDKHLVDPMPMLKNKGMAA